MWYLRVCNCFQKPKDFPSAENILPKTHTERVRIFRLTHPVLSYSDRLRLDSRTRSRPMYSSLECCIHRMMTSAWNAFGFLEQSNSCFRRWCWSCWWPFGQYQSPMIQQFRVMCISNRYLNLCKRHDYDSMQIIFMDLWKRVKK